ncbi:MAG TPA: winged helix-turn-helix transcriptional regulator [Gemmatimonadales bacterium]|nr:winged helix-turn-helix transcriptional regulator [Gemmatimonadales bacterium]
MLDWLQRLTGGTRAEMIRLLRRSRQTITSLAEALGLTDNAVRTHVAALERDGVVTHVGTRRDTGGKPARVYDLTSAGEELFPKAYALVLGSLVEEISRTAGRERTLELLRGVGRRLVADIPASAGPEDRINAAAAVLRGLGGDLDVERVPEGWRLRGYGCPLSAVTGGHPEVCALAQALVEEITGAPVKECCEREGRPRCGFAVAERSA